MAYTGGTKTKPLSYFEIAEQKASNMLEPIYRSGYMGGPGPSASKNVSTAAKNAANAGAAAAKELAAKNTASNSSSANVPSTENSYAALLRDESYYADMIADAIREQQRAAERRLQASIDQGVQTLEAQRPELKKKYEDAARQLYIQNMTAKRDLPQQMAAQGISGGIHESSLVGLDANYGSNLASLEGTYNQALSDIERDIANIRASGELSLAENASMYSQKLAEAAAEAQAAQLAAQKAMLVTDTATEPVRKPNLTYDQAVDLLENGTISPEAEYAYKYFTGSDYLTSDTSTAYKEALIRSIMNSNLSEAEALAKLMAAGITQADILAFQNKWGYKQYGGSR